MNNSYLVVGINGVTTGVNSPVVRQICQTLGDDIQIRRASRVEPSTELSPEASAWLYSHNVPITSWTSWWADLTPVGGPVLGPFEATETALAAEVAWLVEHNIPTATNRILPDDENRRACPIAE